MKFHNIKTDVTVFLYIDQKFTQTCFMILNDITH